MLVVSLNKDKDGKDQAGSHLKAQLLFHSMTGTVRMGRHATQMSVMKTC